MFIFERIFSQPQKERSSEFLINLWTESENEDITRVEYFSFFNWTPRWAPCSFFAQFKSIFYTILRGYKKDHNIGYMYSILKRTLREMLKDFKQNAEFSELVL